MLHGTIQYIYKYNDKITDIGGIRLTQQVTIQIRSV